MCAQFFIISWEASSWQRTVLASRGVMSPERSGAFAPEPPTSEAWFADGPCLCREELKVEAVFLEEVTKHRYPVSSHQC